MDKQLHLAENLADYSLPVANCLCIGGGKKCQNHMRLPVWWEKMGAFGLQSF
jgi:hypothetical protein